MYCVVLIVACDYWSPKLEDNSDVWFF